MSIILKIGLISTLLTMSLAANAYNDNFISHSTETKGNISGKYRCSLDPQAGADKFNATGLEIDLDLRDWLGLGAYYSFDGYEIDGHGQKIAMTQPERFSYYSNIDIVGASVHKLSITPGAENGNRVYISEDFQRMAVYMPVMLYLICRKL